jgi:ABC-type glycerol-3-phosphate transport system substrate-binding protein
VVIEKEVIKEVEVEKPVVVKEEVVKEVVKEVPVEVEKVVEKEVVKEVEKVVEVTPKPAEKVLVRFHGGPGAKDQARGKELFAQFSAEHPGIEIKQEPLPDQWPQKTLAMMAAGTAPDVQLGFGDPMYGFVARGMFMDLQPYIDRDLTQEDINDFVKPQWDFFSFGQEGKKFAMPKYCGTSAFLYNKVMYDDFGIPYPDNTEDWNDTLEIAQKFTTRDDSGRLETVGLDILPGHLGYILSWYVWSWGGEVHVPGDNSVCLLDEPVALEALQFVQDLRFKHKVIGDPSDYDAMSTIGWGLIATGKAAIHRGGSWHIPMALNSCDFPFDCMENPLAPNTKKRETFLTTDGWGVWVGTKNPDAVWEFMKLISVSGTWGQFLIQSSWPLQPSKLSLVDAWIGHLKGTYPRMQDADIEAFTRSFDYARPQVSFCDNPGALEILNPVIDQIYDLGTLNATEGFQEFVPKVNDFLADACPEGGW